MGGAICAPAAYKTHISVLETPKMSTPPDVAVEEMTCAMSRISFKSIIPNAGDVRMTDIDGVQYLWAVDLAMAVTGKNRKDAGEMLGDLKAHLFDKGRFVVKRLPGNGKWGVRLVTIKDALELVMMLPGSVARSVRSGLCQILTRHLSGDPTLAAETANNARIGAVAACEAFLGQAMASAKRMREADPELGYVYGTVSDAFPGLVKIGHTGNLNARLISMNTSCAPLPHRFVAVAPTYHPARDERTAHAYFADQREEGEFFRVTVEELQTFMDRYITPKYDGGYKERL